MFIAARMLASDTEKINHSYVKNLTDVSNRQLDRITRLIEDMLDISRISQGKIILNSQRKNLSALVLDVIQRFTDELNEEKISLTSELEEDIYIYCDPSRIEQVITNLMTNAIRYGQKKPIQLSLRSQGEIAEIEIKDGGIGIAPNNHERIFGRFERAVGFEMSGLGLGLYISKQIIDEHQGKISVESEIDQGATFKVSLPCL
jgi:signal transduction histidine kinase